MTPKDEARAWWRRYELYLRTPQWRLKRRRVIKRDVVCQACLARRATMAHHLTYRRVFDEPLFDLVGVCGPCHKKLHDPAAIAAALRRTFQQGVLS